jgi:hypothetical protein
MCRLDMRYRSEKELVHPERLHVSAMFISCLTYRCVLIARPWFWGIRMLHRAFWYRHIVIHHPGVCQRRRSEVCHGRVERG